MIRSLQKIFFPVVLAWSEVASASTFSLIKNGPLLRFDGEINQESAALINHYLQTGTSVLFVNSQGGNAKAGLQIAQEMIKHPVTVIVDQYCFSSCANYLFLSAQKKSLSPGAVLGFHGGMTGDAPLKKHYRRNLQKRATRYGTTFSCR